MRKYLKNLLTACLAVCITVCVGIFAAACTDKGDEFPSSVTVTVVCDDGTPAAGVGVQICADVCLYQTTNADGVATFNNIKKDNGNIYEAHLDTLPSGYKYVDDNGDPYASNKGVQFDVTKNSSITITLVAE